jgi:hypothetical protein
MMASWLAGCESDFDSIDMLWSRRPSLGGGELLYSAPAGPRGPGPRGYGLHCVDFDWSTELHGTSGDVNNADSQVV